MEAYLKKQQKVERGFRFLKDPLLMASTVFLKSAQRIMALAMIMTLSLMVYSALEHRIRQSLKAHQQTVPDQKGHPTDHPTARWVFQFFTGILLLVIESVREVILNLYGVVSPNPIKFRQLKSSPATILSRSMIGPTLRNV